MRVDKPEDAVQVGDKYTFKILEVDPEGTRISLSLRKAMRTHLLNSITRYRRLAERKDRA